MGVSRPRWCSIRASSFRYFAAFDLLKDARGTHLLRDYFRTTWVSRVVRTLASCSRPQRGARTRDWAAKLGYDAAALENVNRQSIRLLEEVRDELESPRTPIVISGNLGPRGDGYQPGSRMSAQEAADYHGAQIRTFASTAADMVAAFTMNYVEEAMGIARGGA